MQFTEIIGETRLAPHREVDFDALFDHVFWVGDLNYRCVPLNSPGRGGVCFVAPMHDCLRVFVVPLLFLQR